MDTRAVEKDMVCFMEGKRGDNHARSSFRARYAIQSMDIFILNYKGWPGSVMCQDRW